MVHAFNPFAIGPQKARCYCWPSFEQWFGPHGLQRPFYLTLLNCIWKKKWIFFEVGKREGLWNKRPFFKSPVQYTFPNTSDSLKTTCFSNSDSEKMTTGFNNRSKTISHFDLSPIGKCEMVCSHTAGAIWSTSEAWQGHD